MVSSFASQLQAIALKSTNELDLKARRIAHAESLLFDREVAVKQDFETIYQICIEGFRDLCLLDPRFRDFDQNLFAEQSKSQDREELTKTQNEALDLVIRQCLMLLGGRILLKPALKALEWLVRRFKAHIYNTDDMLHTLLPYHEVSVWANALTIIPNEKVVGQWKFVRPYLKSTWTVPRHALAYAASHDDTFFASLNTYILDACRQTFISAIHMKFWSSLIVEAISTRLAHTKSGRKEVQVQRIEDLLHKVLPLLNEGYEISTCQDLTTTCYTITIVLAAKAELADHVLDSLSLAVYQSLGKAEHEIKAALVTISVIASNKRTATVPKRVLDILSGLQNFDVLVRNISEYHSCQRLMSILVATAMAVIKRKNVKKLAEFVSTVTFLMYDLYPNNLVDDAIIPVLSKLIEVASVSGPTTEVCQELTLVVQRINAVPGLSEALSEAVSGAQLDPDVLQSLLGATIASMEVPASHLNEDVMEDVSVTVETHHVDPQSIPIIPSEQCSFLTTALAGAFERTAEVFVACCNKSDDLDEFRRLPTWLNAEHKDLIWQTFLIRFACSSAAAQARQKALKLLIDSLRAHPDSSVQSFIPYTLTLLTDVKSLRQVASKLLYILKEMSLNEDKDVVEDDIYGSDTTEQVTPISKKQTHAILTDIIHPAIEECILDPSYIVTTVKNALRSQNTTDGKKSHRQALFSLLVHHALLTPCIKVKVTIVSMLDQVNRIGGKSKMKLLLPILQEWSRLSIESAKSVAQEGGFSIEATDTALVKLADMQDGAYLEEVTRIVNLPNNTLRPGFVQALLEHVRQHWSSWNAQQHITCAETLFGMSFYKDQILSAAAQDVLRSVDLSSEVLATLLQLSEVGSSDVKGPPSKKKRRSSSGASQSRIEVARTIDDATAKISFSLELVDNNSPESKPELVSMMFEMLACLKRLQQNRIESPYLLALCLSSIHAMIQSLGSGDKTADISGIKPELITECLRSSDNPQVQNVSLLALSALSAVVPDRMVHNIMPIFTFIGRKMLSKDDEHSINLVNEAVEKIVPALLESLRQGSSVHTYHTSMSAMLANFTSAYEHMPRHRRASFYQKLLFSIDVNDLGFILIALLAAQEDSTPSFRKFLEDLTSILSSTSRLTIYQQLIKLSVDVFSASPKTSPLVFNFGQDASTAVKLPYVRSTLTAAIAMLQADVSDVKSTNRARAMSEQPSWDMSLLRSCFETTLHAIRDLDKTGEEVGVLTKQCLDTILQLPNTVDLLAILDVSLEDMNASQLRPQALGVLAIQLRRMRKTDTSSRNAALSFLPKLNTYVNPQEHPALIQASLACCNHIIEIYGRKQPERIICVAETILNHSLAAFQKDTRVIGAAILTIASIVEVSKESFVPLVFDTISQTLSLVGSSKTFKQSLINSVCSLLTAMFSNVAFVVSQEQVGQVFERMLTAETTPMLERQDNDLSFLLRSIAQNMELETLIAASMAVLESTTEVKYTKASILLDMVGQAIDVSSKAIVIAQSENISRLFQLAMSMAANAVQHDRSIEGTRQINLSDQLKSTSTKFIYKINDTTFRPIFENWVEWAISPETPEKESRPIDHQIALFELLVHFFETLKAIVTSYATYLLSSISAILKSATLSRTSTKFDQRLLKTTLTLLRSIALHDQDSFFSAPSHFDPIAEPLISNLNLAASKGQRPLVDSHVIPAILALASATVDSPTAHGTLVHFLVQLKSDSSARVRLASAKTLVALTEDGDIGNDFVANTIGIGAGEGEGARGGGSSVGEIMIYVNEMLEDDDEDVEQEVRRWVQMVRAQVGEDVFEV